MPGSCRSRASSAGTGHFDNRRVLPGRRRTGHHPDADRDVALGTCELFVAPRGVEHCPRTGAETAILPSEPGGVASTGDLGRPLIAEVEEWA